MPFDRLIEAIDNIAPHLGEPVFAQIGPSSYRPKNFDFSATVAPKLFEEKFKEASCIVSHAGIGSVLTAQKHRKPIILFPRRAALGEHRNDHQLATCSRLKGKAGIFVANDQAEIQDLLLSGLRWDSEPGAPSSSKATVFASRIAEFIGGKRPSTP